MRSEAIVVLFIQRSDIVRRNYATILGVRTVNDGHKELGILGPCGKSQKRLFEELYAEAGVDPSKVDYVETHGSGTQRGDTQELGAIADVFCQKRGPPNPLLIGSCKTNMGHSEPTAGLASIVKVILSLQEHLIPANLHFKNPNPNIPSLFNGQLKVSTSYTLYTGWPVILCHLL